MLSVAKIDSVWDTANDFALQRELAEFGVGMVVVEVLSGPINDDDCMNLMNFVLNKYLGISEDECNVKSRDSREVKENVLGNWR